MAAYLPSHKPSLSLSYGIDQFYKTWLYALILVQVSIKLYRRLAIAHAAGLPSSLYRYNPFPRISV